MITLLLLQLSFLQPTFSADKSQFYEERMKLVAEKCAEEIKRKRAEIDSRPLTHDQRLEELGAFLELGPVKNEHGEIVNYDCGNNTTPNLPEMTTIQVEMSSTLIRCASVKESGEIFYKNVKNTNLNDIPYKFYGFKGKKTKAENFAFDRKGKSRFSIDYFASENDQGETMFTEKTMMLGNEELFCSYEAPWGPIISDKVFDSRATELVCKKTNGQGPTETKRGPAATELYQATLATWMNKDPEAFSAYEAAKLNHRIASGEEFDSIKGCKDCSRDPNGFESSSMQQLLKEANEIELFRLTGCPQEKKVLQIQNEEKIVPFVEEKKREETEPTPLVITNAANCSCKKDPANTSVSLPDVVCYNDAAKMTLLMSCKNVAPGSAPKNLVRKPSIRAFSCGNQIEIQSGPLNIKTNCCNENIWSLKDESSQLAVEACSRLTRADAGDLSSVESLETTKQTTLNGVWFNKSPKSKVTIKIINKP